MKTSAVLSGIVLVASVAIAVGYSVMFPNAPWDAGQFAGLVFIVGVVTVGIWGGIRLIRRKSDRKT